MEYFARSRVETVIAFYKLYNIIYLLFIDSVY